MTLQSSVQCATAPSTFKVLWQRFFDLNPPNNAIQLDKIYHSVTVGFCWQEEMPLGSSGKTHLTRQPNWEEQRFCIGATAPSDGLGSQVICTSGASLPFVHDGPDAAGVAGHHHANKAFLLHGETFDSRKHCPFCQYVASTPSSLRDHLRTHTGEKPYVCPHCHVAASVRSNMRRHIKKMHPYEDNTVMEIRPQ